MAERDPHSVLGVRRGAAPQEIRKAYIALVKRFHPDVNPGGEEQFKAINSAYGLLSDGRRRDCRAASAPSRSERAAPRPEAGEWREFSDLFGVARKQASGQTLQLAVDFFDAIFGTTRRLWTGPRESVEIVVPAGARDRQILNLPGGIRVALKVTPHPFFRRIGQDIWVMVPISLDEAASGARINVPTITGRVPLLVSKGTTSGTVLRIPGRGVAAANGIRGDQYVRIRVLDGPSAARTPEKPGPGDFLV